MEDSQPEIVPADRRLRRLAVAAVVLLSIGGVAGILSLRSSMDQIDKLKEDDLPAAAHRLQSVVAVVAWVGGLSFVGCALWLFQLGWRTNRAGRYPPPGMKVIKDTPVRTGSAARAIANLALVGALLAAAVGTLGMWRLYQVAAELLQDLAAGG